MTTERKAHKKSRIGRPPMYSDPAKMEARIERYFKKCPDTRIVVFDGGSINVPTPTISGLALYLGFCDRHQMYTYELKPAFSNTIKRARAMLTRVYESNMHGAQCTGSIFMLKNLGYTDRTEIETKAEIKTTHIVTVKFEQMPEAELTQFILNRRNGHKAELN